MLCRVWCFWCSVCKSSQFHWCNNVQYSSHVMSDDVIHDSRTAQIFRCHMTTAEVRITISRDAHKRLCRSRQQRVLWVNTHLSNVDNVCCRPAAQQAHWLIKHPVGKLSQYFGHSNTSGQYSQKLNSAHLLIYFLISLHYNLLNAMYEYKWQQYAFSYLQPREIKFQFELCLLISTLRCGWTAFLNTFIHSKCFIIAVVIYKNYTESILWHRLFPNIKNENSALQIICNTNISL